MPFKICYLAELFCQIVCYLAELFRKIALPKKNLKVTQKLNEMTLKMKTSFLPFTILSHKAKVHVALHYFLYFPFLLKYIPQFLNLSPRLAID